MSKPAFSGAYGVIERPRGSTGAWQRAAITADPEQARRVAYRLGQTKEVIVWKVLRGTVVITVWHNLPWLYPVAWE